MGAERFSDGHKELVKGINDFHPRRKRGDKSLEHVIGILDKRATCKIPEIRFGVLLERSKSEL